MENSQVAPGAEPRYSGEFVLRRVVGVALLGAAFVHFAAAPPHLDEQFRHGMFFVLVGWVQFLLGVFLLAKPRGRAFLVTTAAINLAIVVVWIVSRTAGIDGPAETIGFGDTFSVVLEVLAAAGAIMLGTPAVQRPHVAKVPARVVFGATTGVVVGLFAMALSYGLATDHDRVHVNVAGDTAGDGHASSHGDGNPAMGEVGHNHAEMLRKGKHAHGESETDPEGTEHAHDGSDPSHAAAHPDGGAAHAHGTGTAAAGSHAHDATGTQSAHAHTDTGGTTGATHDHGSSGGTTDTTHNHGGTGGTTPTTHNHGGGTGGTTPTTHDHGGGGTDWETTRRAALMGGVSTADYNARTAAMARYLTNEIRGRGNFAGVSESVREARIKTYVDWSSAHALDGEHGVGNHAHGPEQWQTMDAATTAALNAQLNAAKSILPNYPTAAHAVAAGYMQVTPWMPGIGAHYLNVGNLFSFDPLHPAFLLYNGNSSSSVLVGVSYSLLTGAAAPAGFAGPNDHWHEHPALCLLGGSFVIGADNTPADLCQSVGGAKSNGFFGQHLFMMHLWQVPGWSSSWGLMSGESPAINYARTDIR